MVWGSAKAMTQPGWQLNSGGYNVNGGGYSAHIEGDIVSDEGGTYPMKGYSRG